MKNLLKRMSQATIIGAFVIIAGSSALTLVEGYIPDWWVMLQQVTTGLAVGVGAVNAVDELAKENK